MSYNSNNLNKISAIKILNTFKNLITIPNFLNLICSQNAPENDNKRFALLIRQDQDLINYNKSFIDLDKIEQSFSQSEKSLLELNGDNPLVLTKNILNYAKQKYLNINAIIVFYNIIEHGGITEGTTLIKFSVEDSYRRLAKINTEN